MHRSGGVAAIVCDTGPQKTQCDRGIATPVSRYGGGVFRSGHQEKVREERKGRFCAKGLGSLRPSTEPETPKPPKSLKKVPRERIFWTFPTFFGTFWGFGVGGVPNSSLGTFLRLFGVSGFPAL